MEMLSLPTWREEPLTLHFFSSSHLELQCGGPPLPLHMRVDVAPMEVSISYPSTTESIVQCQIPLVVRSICFMPRIEFSHRGLSEGCRLFPQLLTMTLISMIPMVALEGTTMTAAMKVAAALL